jgi:hypothetical protein
MGKRSGSRANKIVLVGHGVLFAVALSGIVYALIDPDGYFDDGSSYRSGTLFLITWTVMVGNSGWFVLRAFRNYRAKQREQSQQD